MGNHRKIVNEIVERYINGKYPPSMEWMVQQWLVDESMFEEKDRALREQWDKLRVKPDKVSVRASYEKVKRILGFE